MSNLKKLETAYVLDKSNMTRKMRFQNWGSSDLPSVLIIEFSGFIETPVLRGVSMNE